MFIAQALPISPSPLAGIDRGIDAIVKEQAAGISGTR
jgi:hypothetical protein